MKAPISRFESSPRFDEINLKPLPSWYAIYLVCFVGEHPSQGNRAENHCLQCEDRNVTYQMSSSRNLESSGGKFTAASWGWSWQRIDPTWPHRPRTVLVQYQPRSDIAIYIAISLSSKLLAGWPTGFSMSLSFGTWCDAEYFFVVETPEIICVTQIQTGPIFIPSLSPCSDANMEKAGPRSPAA